MLSRIFDKLGVSTRVELALYAINNAKGNPSAAASDHHTEPEQAKRAT